MEKRTVIFGTPRCVVWPSVVAGFLFVIALCGLLVGMVFMALDGVMETVHRTEGGGRSFFWYWVAEAGLVLVWWWLSSSSRRFRKRLKRFDGRVCLRCKREIGEGETHCGGCGALWSLEGLGKGWKKAAAPQSEDHLMKRGKRRHAGAEDGT